MKIVVFGASRGMGLNVVEQALQTGLVLTAFVRTPSRFTLQHPGLILVQGDSTDAAAVEKAMAGQDAVISTLGPTRPPMRGMMESSARNIVAAMKKHGVRRLVSTTGAGVRQPEDQPKLADHVITALLKLLAKDVWLDSARNVEVIRDSGLEWTIVRFPRLVDGPATGKVRAGYVNKESSTQLSREDAAAFVLQELVEKKWVGKLPMASY